MLNGVAQLDGLVQPAAASTVSSPPRLFPAFATAGIAVAVGEVLTTRGVLPGLAISLAAVAVISAGWVRVRPLLVVAIMACAEAARSIVAGLTDMLVTLTFVQAVLGLYATYALARYDSRRNIGLGALILIPGLLMLGVVDPEVGFGWAAGSVIATIALFGLGLARRSQAALHEQRIRTREIQDRRELASDIHDSVAHHVSSIAIGAEAALQLADTGQHELRATLRDMKRTASAALVEMRRLVANLHNSETDDSWPTLADIQDFAIPVNSSPSVSLSVEVDPALIPKQMSKTTYRIVQEAITNARRHAVDASRIDVHVALIDETLAVEVRNDGTLDGGPTGSGGLGLDGIAARVRRLGGTVTSGPSPDNAEWLVRASLPITVEP